MQPKLDPVDIDELVIFFLEMMRFGSGKSILEFTNDAWYSEALERILKKKNDTLAKDSSDIDTLIDHLWKLKDYLQLKLPDKIDLFRDVLSLVIFIMEQARVGSLHPIISRKVCSRPTDCLPKKTFKIACVIAADLYYEADKQAGLHRRFLKRPEADAIICRQSRVQKAAKELGLSPTPTALKGWRREVREAPENSVVKVTEFIVRAKANHIMEQRGIEAAVNVLLGAPTVEQPRASIPSGEKRPLLSPQIRIHTDSIDYDGVIHESNGNQTRLLNQQRC